MVLILLQELDFSGFQIPGLSPSFSCVGPLQSHPPSGTPGLESFCLKAVQGKVSLACWSPLPQVSWTSLCYIEAWLDLLQGLQASESCCCWSTDPLELKMVWKVGRKVNTRNVSLKQDWACLCSQSDLLYGLYLRDQAKGTRDQECRLHCIGRSNLGQASESRNYEGFFWKS